MDEKQTGYLRSLCACVPVFPKEVLNWVTEENLWNLWIPEEYGGLERSLTVGLQTLQSLARTDGSLGWTVTLCSGANFFAGNLRPEVVRKLFGAGQRPIFGGSGGIFGIAEKAGSGYRLSGTWRYATGAPYLTHFTLNAAITTGGEKMLQEDGSPVFRSFLIPASEVEVIPDWNTMGLKASATHSFRVQDLYVEESRSFAYNQFYLEEPIFKIPFDLFADLTLWVNYLGMAEHWQEEACRFVSEERLQKMNQALEKACQLVSDHASETEGREDFDPAFLRRVHSDAAASVKHLSQEIVAVFPYLGVKASREDHPLNQVFRDFFTGTQHHIFTKDPITS